MGALLSEILQLILGVAAFLAMTDASRRSGRFSRRVWFLSAAAMGIYTAGQAIHTYYVAFNVPFAYDRVTSEFFFFWVTPLLIAAVLSADLEEILDWDLLLDLSQFLVLALALHLLVLGSSSQWQRHPLEMDLLDWKTRIARDILVLIVLTARAFWSRWPEARALFLRLACF